MVLNTDGHRLIFLSSANAPSERGLERDMSKRAFVRAEEELSLWRTKQRVSFERRWHWSYRGKYSSVAALNHLDLYDPIDHHSHRLVLSATSMVVLEIKTCVPDIPLF